MVNKDILGGLKSALTRGYSLEEAMLSFFNAGYKRNEIEEAAQALQGTISAQPQVVLQPQPIWPKKQPQVEPGEISKPKFPTKVPTAPVPVVSMPVVQTVVEQPVVEEKPVQKIQAQLVVQPQPKQPVISRISTYPNYRSRIRTITIILVILLIILLGILGLMYIFKNQIIAFFNSIFSNA